MHSTCEVVAHCLVITKNEIKNMGTTQKGSADLVRTFLVAYSFSMKSLS